MATIDDVAQEAQVSKTTVSRVLNNSERVKADTRARVLAVAQRLGYSTARAAAQPQPESGRRNIGAILTQAPWEPGLMHYEKPSSVSQTAWDRTVLRGMETVLQAEGFNLFVTYMPAYDPQAELPMFVKTNQVAGVVIVGGLYSDEYVRRLRHFGLEVMVIGSYMPDPDVQCIYADNYWGTFMGVSHLLDLGRRRVALLNGPSQTRTSADKLRGYREAHDVRNVALDPGLVNSQDFSAVKAYAGMSELWPYRPDAVICSHSSMAEGVMHFLRDQKANVPREVAVVGYQEENLVTVIKPALTYVSYMSWDMGQEAGLRMVQAVNGGRAIGLKTAFPTRLIVRESCGARETEVAG